MVANSKKKIVYGNKLKDEKSVCYHNSKFASKTRNQYGFEKNDKNKCRFFKKLSRFRLYKFLIKWELCDLWDSVKLHDTDLGGLAIQ